MLPYVDKIEFELQPGPNKGADGKPLLFARHVPAVKFDLDYIDRFCANYHGTHRGEIKNLFETFLEVAGSMLSSGFRLKTPIGSFSLKLKLNGNFSDPNVVKASDVSYDGVEFIPSKKLLQQCNPAERKKGFRKRLTQVGNAQMYDEQAMEAALRRSVSNGYITVKSFQVCSGLKYKSARSYLDGLCEGDAPRLRREKDAGAFHYFPVNRQDSDQ